MIRENVNLPEWSSRDDSPSEEGCYIAKWSNGDIEPAWFVKYSMNNGCFQRKCGTEEGGEGWAGNVGVVERWCYINVPG